MYCQYNKSYSKYSYWENKIINNDNLWCGNFDNKKITKDSVIIYSGMINNDKNIFEHGWVVYPNIYTALGFIQNVFLPTATVTWNKNNADGILVPIIHFDEVLDKLISDGDSSFEDFYEVRDIYNKIDDLWNKENKNIKLEVSQLLDKCNKMWVEEPYKKIFIKAFFSVDEIIPFVRSIIGFDELLEEETNMSKEKLECITEENVLKDEFLNKILVELLNNNMPVLF